MGWLIEISTWFAKHPKVTRALHTFWQAALGSFVGGLGLWLPILQQYDPSASNAGVIWSGFVSVTIGAISAGCSAVKSLLAGCPEERNP
jgi:hypothetical protein